MFYIEITTNMAKLYFNTRDEMTCIDTDKIALVKADGNYSKVVYINGKEINLTFGISKMDTILKENNDRRNKFVKIGRSYILNHFFVFKIEPLKQTMLLSDGEKYTIKVSLPKKTLKAYKDAIRKIKTQQDKTIEQ